MPGGVRQAGSGTSSDGCVVLCQQHYTRCYDGLHHVGKHAGAPVQLIHAWAYSDEDKAATTSRACKKTKAKSNPCSPPPRSLVKSASPPPLCVQISPTVWQEIPGPWKTPHLQQNTGVHKHACRQFSITAGQHSAAQHHWIPGSSGMLLCYTGWQPHVRHMASQDTETLPLWRAHVCWPSTHLLTLIHQLCNTLTPHGV
jgi:hypothetical protein